MPAAGDLDQEGAITVEGTTNRRTSAKRTGVINSATACGVLNTVVKVDCAKGGRNIERIAVEIDRAVKIERLACDDLNSGVAVKRHWDLELMAAGLNVDGRIASFCFKSNGGSTGDVNPVCIVQFDRPHRDGRVHQHG